MSETNLRIKPAFGQRRMAPRYYSMINDVINVLRPTATLNTICAHLNRAKLSTPTGLEWTKSRLSNYLSITDLST